MTFPLTVDLLADGANPASWLNTQVAAGLAARLRVVDPPVHALVTEGLRRLHQAVAACRAGEPLTDLTVVQLSWDLQVTRICGEAWSALVMDPDTMIGLLLDLTERVEEPLRVPMLTMLAYAAWRSGDVEAAHAGLVTVLRINPDYSLAKLLHLALHLGIPLSDLDIPSPAETAQAMGPAHAAWLTPLQPLLARYAPLPS
ncbi:DUF4192 family protein [Streptosporangium canum]|uniref:DUF4192 family protein n=1 Tax=Streptosporangium canum TaxID=324952 RepID=UPI0036B20F3F